MQNALDWSQVRWTAFRKDVWDDPSVRPVAGILLSLLATLLAWLPIEYAPSAAAGADIPYGEAEGGSINPYWGRVMIVLMTIATLTAETTNFPRKVAEAALAHTIGDKVEAVYRRGDLFDKRCRLMDAWAGYLETPPAAGAAVNLKRRENFWP